MGMDVIGTAPRGKEGEYFRANVWLWRPLPDYCCEVAPEISDACRNWHTNDGDGLDSDGAYALAEVLQAEINSGRTLCHERRRNHEMQMLPNEPCRKCASTQIWLPTASQIKCARCGGSGSYRPWSTNYEFDVAHVQKFVNF